MNIIEVLQMDLNDSDNRKLLKKSFSKCCNKYSIKDLNDTTKLIRSIEKVLKKLNFDLVNTLNYVGGAKYILIDYNEKRNYMVTDNSVKGVYIKALVFADVYKKKGNKNG